MRKKIRLLDIFYKAHAPGEWLVITFRLYTLYAIDSPLPVSRKITVIPFMRERGIDQIVRLLKSETWVTIPLARNISGDGIAYFSFLSIGEVGLSYDETIARAKVRRGLYPGISDRPPSASYANS